MIPVGVIEEAAYAITERAAIDIPSDYRAGIERMVDLERGDLSSFVLKAMLDNWEVAAEDRRPICADTGMPRFFVKIGDEARLQPRFTELETVLRRTVARATTEIPLRQPRPSAVADRSRRQRRYQCARD